MLNKTKENIKKKIFKSLNKGGDPEAIKQKINDIRSKEFINLKNTTTTNNTRNSSPGVTFNVYNRNSSISDDPFFWLWLSSSLSHSNRSDYDSSSSGCIGDCSGGDGDGEGCCIFMIIIAALAVIFTNAYISAVICCKLQESKNNGNKILGSCATFVVQASICAGLIFFIIKASEVIVDDKSAGLLFAGVNAVISAIACLACLCFFIIALYERHQNSKIAEEYAELAMKKLESIDGESFSNSPLPGVKEESTDQKPSLKTTSLKSIDIRGKGDVPEYDI